MTKSPYDPFAQPCNQVNLSVIVPVFNEVKTVRRALDDLLGALSGQDSIAEIQIIIVESNSTDGTRELVLPYESHPLCEVILENRPKGKGAAVRRGFTRVTGDTIVIYDADCEYQPSDIPNLLVPILRGETSFVLGSRHTGGAIRQFDGAQLTAKVMNAAHWVFASMFNTLYGTKLKDPFTMYKMFRVAAITDLYFEANRFDFDFELVGKLVRNGSHPVELPVTYSSRHFSDGKKIRKVRDPLTWCRALIKYRYGRLKMN